MRAILAAIALALSVAALPAARNAAQNPVPAADANVTRIVHVTVVDVATGKESSDQTVVLQGERIVSVAASDPAANPQGRVLDAHGGFLIPGLWDMHVHMQDLEDLPLYIANGVTGVRMMFGVKKPAELRARLGKEAAAPEVLLGSIIVDGDPPVWPGSIIIRNAKDARRAVDEIKESGADLVLLSADPLAEIHNTTQIQAVWLRGKYFDRAALDQLLAAARHRHGKSKLDSSLW